MAFNLEWSASVNTLEFVADSTRVLISAAVWSAVALASIALSLLSRVSVRLFVSDSLNSAVFISAPVWSAVALASIAFSFVWSASVKTLESDADSTSVLISEADWSAVALVSIPSSLFLRVVVKLLSVWLATERSMSPVESWYVTVIPLSVFVVVNIAPTISCTCSFDS